MQTLFAITLSCAFAALLFTLATHAAVNRVLGWRRTSEHAPPISVLKPLKGVDHELYDNLAALARQDYPNFEIVLGCEDPQDPALLVAERLKREFPQVPMRVVAGASQRGMNPKVNNLRTLSAAASHDCLLVSDASVRPRRGYLTAMAAELSDASVGLVSSVLVGVGERDLGARLDNLQMNSFVLRGVCGAYVLARHPCVVGKSMLFRRSVLDKLGGFTLVDNVLAEDYVLGQRFAQAGYRVALSAHAVPSLSVSRSLADFWSRHLRWSQMRRRLSPVLYLLEVLHSPLPWLLLGVALLLGGAVGEGRGWCALSIAGGLWLRLASDGVLAAKLRGAPLTVADYAALLLKDLLCLGIWLAGGLCRTVRWRGNEMRIGPGSVLHPLEDEQRSAEMLEGA